jgi:NAD(P)-dependent dehydrogenase (short-subunit alcohol dehydrogenase family)
MKNVLDFSGKVALVTGAAAGMGLATANAFAEAGAAVVLADYKEDVVTAAAERLIAAGHKAIAIGCDVSDDVQVAAMVDRTLSEFGRLDAAFNNAGLWRTSLRPPRAPARSGTASSGSTCGVSGVA